MSISDEVLGPRRNESFQRCIVARDSQTAWIERQQYDYELQDDSIVDLIIDYNITGPLGPFEEYLTCDWKDKGKFIELDVDQMLECKDLVKGYCSDNDK